jgi:hypothetical protein
MLRLQLQLIVCSEVRLQRCCLVLCLLPKDGCYYVSDRRLQLVVSSGCSQTAIPQAFNRY